MQVISNETLEQKEQRLELYFIDWEDELIERETKVENACSVVSDLLDIARKTLQSAKSLKEILTCDYVDCDEGNVLYYSETHIIFCEKMLDMISKLQNDLKDELDLD